MLVHLNKMSQQVLNEQKYSHYGYLVKKIKIIHKIALPSVKQTKPTACNDYFEQIAEKKSWHFVGMIFQALLSICSRPFYRILVKYPEYLTS